MIRAPQVRSLALAAALALGLAAAPAASVAQESSATPAGDGPQIGPAGTPTFPDRALRLSVPEGRSLTTAQIELIENGDPVRDVTLTSADAPRATDFGIVLVIDASSSMHGAAIRRAISAARQLANKRSAAQQLGVIAFNSSPEVLIAPSSDQQAIERALARTPRLRSQTRIFDAAGKALNLLDEARITAGSIVVLSDGADTGSAVSSSAVSARARRANVRIFTVGLRSRAFTQSELRGLADAGRGRYVPADSVDDLGRIFRDLGSELASEYLVRYRSVQQPGRSVTVAARVDGVDGVATMTYKVPGGASFVLVEDSFWTSKLGILVAALLCAALLALAMAILIVRRHRPASLRERVRGFVSSPDATAATGELVMTGRAARGIAERSLERLRWWPAFREDCEITRIEAEPVRIVLGTAFATLLAGYVLVTVAPPLAGLFALAIPFAVRAWLRHKLNQQRDLFSDQLPDILQGSASAIRAGHGLTGALTMIAEEAPEPSRREFARVIHDERLGVPLDDALRVVERRMVSRDVRQIALVAELQRETGGNMAEVLDRVTEGLRERSELRRLVRTLTAQGRLSRWVVTALPPILLLVITIINPGYVDPLYTTTAGNVLLAVGVALAVAGSLVIKKIVNFEV